MAGDGGFSEVLLDALSEVTEQVDGWQAIAETTENSLEWFHEDLQNRFSRIDEALGQLDDDLAEQDHVQAEQRIDEVQEALTGVDTLLVKMRVLTELVEAADSESNLDADSTDLDDVVGRAPTLSAVEANLPDEDADISDDEWSQHLSDAVRDVAGMVRDAGRDVEEAWSGAVDAVSKSLQDVVTATMGLHARSRRLRDAYDEWFAILGSLSNMAPERLGGVAAIQYDALSAWINSAR